MSFLRGLFGPPDVGKMKAARDVAGLIRALGYEKDPGARQAAARALDELHSTASIECLAPLLNEGDAGLPVAVGAIGDSTAVDPLIGMLKDGEATVRKLAIKALVTLFLRNRTDITVAAKILEQRKVIHQSHDDSHDDSPCFNWNYHRDSGTGTSVNFPL